MWKKSGVMIIMTVILIAMMLFSFSSDSKAKTEDRSTTNVSGKIDQHVFYTSVPRQMTVGKSYEIMVFVRNTGREEEYCQIALVAPSEFIYPQYSVEMATLNSGEPRRFKFLITPVKAHIGEINIIAKLFSVSPTQNIELDSVSAPVFLIEQASSTTGIITASISVTVILIVILIIFYVFRS
jgi:preprotein translocase subunit YajC